MVVAVALLLAAAVAAFAVWSAVAGAARLRSSPAYAEALARARSHPAVIEALGEPIVAGRRVRGEVEHRGAGGHAHLTVPLAGPRGGGRLEAEAERRGEVWSFLSLELRLDDGDSIDLLAAPAPPEETGTIVRRLAPPPAPPTALRPASAHPWHAVGIDGRS